MSVWKRIAFFLGFLWVSPVSILFWILGLILWITGQLEKVYIQGDFVIIWDLKNDGWFCRLFFKERGWGGFSCGCNCLVIDSDRERWGRTLLHESKHCHQQYALGIFFFPVYILESVYVWCFKSDDHSYYDNWFEVSARRYAGQPLLIPKIAWADGPGDRWAWW